MSSNLNNFQFALKKNGTDASRESIDLNRSGLGFASVSSRASSSRAGLLNSFPTNASSRNRRDLTISWDTETKILSIASPLENRFSIRVYDNYLDEEKDRVTVDSLRLIEPFPHRFMPLYTCNLW